MEKKSFDFVVDVRKFYLTYNKSYIVFSFNSRHLLLLKFRCKTRWSKLQYAKEL